MKSHPGAPCPTLPTNAPLKDAVCKLSFVRRKVQSLEIVKRFMEIRPKGSHDFELVPPECPPPGKMLRARCRACSRECALILLQFNPCRKAKVKCSEAAIRRAWNIAKKEVQIKWQADHRTRRALRARKHPCSGVRIGEASHPGP